MEDIVDKKAKLEDLHRLRERHASQVRGLLERFKEIIRQCVEDEDKWNKQVHPFLLLTFNTLVMQSLSQINWNRRTYCELAIDIVRFIEEVL